MKDNEKIIVIVLINAIIFIIMMTVMSTVIIQSKMAQSGDINLDGRVDLIDYSLLVNKMEEYNGFIN